MKSFLTAEEAKDIREIAENLNKKWKQEEEKREEDFYMSETGRAYKKHIEVFGVAPIALGLFDGRDDPALGKMYVEAIEKGVALDMSSDLGEYIID